MRQDIQKARHNSDTFDFDVATSCGSFYTAPDFRSGAASDGTRTSFNSQILKGACVSCFLICLLNLLKTWFCSTPKDLGIELTFAWLVRSWPLEILCCAWNVVMILMLSLPKLQSFCRKWFHTTCECTIALAYLSLVWARTCIEIKHQKEECERIQLKNDSSMFTFPNLAMSAKNGTIKDGSASFGENRIMSDKMLPLYVVLSLCPTIFGLTPKSGIRLGMFQFLVLAGGLVASGSRTATMLTGLTFQFCASMMGTYLCSLHSTALENHCSLAQRTQSACQANRNLLHTFIPENVEQMLNSHVCGTLLAQELKLCIIMFCALDGQERDQNYSEKYFHLLNNLFSEFDDAVQRHGMFKYQHVKGWYIVACPRSARPFDQKAQDEPYPQRYAVKMLLLADELRTIALHFRFGKVQGLQLKVGINVGPAAGAVIGSHRRFYCIYGDVINTAARICKLAGKKPLCASPFAEYISEKCCDWLKFQSVGFHAIKGKGQMELFQVSLKRKVFKSGPFSPRILAHSKDKPSHEIQSEEFRIDCKWMRFYDFGTEQRFMQARLPSQNRELFAAILIHGGMVAMQLQAILLYEVFWDKIAHKSDTMRSESASAILRGHFALLCCYLFPLLPVMFIHPDSISFPQQFIALKLIHICVSVLACWHFPNVWSWLLVYPVHMLSVNLAVGSLHYCTTVGVMAFTFALFLGANLSLGTFSAQAVTCVLLCQIISAIISRLAYYSRRVNWSLQQVLQEELVTLQENLCDLLPAELMIDAMQMTRAAQSVDAVPLILASYAPRRQIAAILQLDLCEFTTICEALSPMDVSALVHGLFSKFDQAVVARGFNKMDTIGDAYVVFGLLPSENHGSRYLCETTTARKKTCRDLLAVAREMIMAVKECGEAGGRMVRCRVGLAVGPVMAGVLGKLQPRFHLVGAAERAAERLEQAAPVNSVHPSRAFLQSLSDTIPRNEHWHEYFSQVEVEGWQVVSCGINHAPQGHHDAVYVCDKVESHPCIKAISGCKTSCCHAAHSVACFDVKVSEAGTANVNDKCAGPVCDKMFDIDGTWEECCGLALTPVGNWE